MSDVYIIRTDVEDMFGDITGFMSFMYSPVILACLKNSGFIAGGYPRFLLAQKRADVRVDAFPINYFANGGDIDVFFPTSSTFQAAKQEVMSLLNSPGSVSAARFGHNFIYTMHNMRCKIQLIESNIGLPAEILSGFDIKNSMVGFNIRHAYVFDGWNDLEDSKIIDVNRINGDANMFGQRVGKYVSKYGYKKLTPKSEILLADWYSKKKFDHTKRLYNAEDILRTPSPGDCSPSLFFSEAFMGNILSVDVISDNELLTDFVGLGTVCTYSSEDYFRGTGKSTVIDAVIHALQKRKADQHVMTLAEKKLQDYTEYKRSLELVRSQRFGKIADSARLYISHK